MPVPSRTPAARHRWRMLDKVKRAAAGICRDCPRSCIKGRRQTVLCSVCSTKNLRRRPDALPAFNLSKRELRAQAEAHFHPLRDDRRQNGKSGSALAWALMMRDV